jgi:thioredoxin-like negative regulator of GroEL
VAGMSADPHYVYGQGQSSRSSYPILLGMVVVEAIGYKEKKYRPDWKRIALLFPAFLLLVWVALSEANYFKERYMNGIPTTRRADMYLYLPDTLANSAVNLFLGKEQVRLRERDKLLSVKDSYGRAAHLYRKGEYYVTVAKAALARQDYAEFAKYIGTGAQLTPANLEAQRLCADLFFAFQRPIDGYQLLEESLAFAKQDREYFRHYIYRCFMLDQDARLIATATKYMGDQEVAADIKADLQIAAAQAHFLRGNFAEASKLIKDYRLDQTADGYLLNCQILWESGDRQGALAEIDAALAAYPAGIRLLEIKARWLKETGELARAKDCLDLLAISMPDKPGPLIQSLYLMPGDANRTRRADVVEKAVARYGNQEQAMLDLARFGNDTADVALTAKLAKLAKDRRFTNRVRFDLVHVECLLNAGRARETILLVDELYRQAERDQWVAETRIAFEALRTIAYFADGQTEIGSINLQKLMQNRNVPPQVLISASRKLIAAQRYDEANDVLVQAHLQNETNQAVLQQIVQLKLDHPRIAADLETYLRRLMLNRRPSKEVLRTALRRLGSDVYLFSGDRETLLRDVEAKLR